jgi:hypothetical protein
LLHRANSISIATAIVDVVEDKFTCKVSSGRNLTARTGKRNVQQAPSAFVGWATWYLIRNRYSARNSHDGVVDSWVGMEVSFGEVDKLGLFHSARSTVAKYSGNEYIHMTATNP